MHNDIFTFHRWVILFSNEFTLQGGPKPRFSIHDIDETANDKKEMVYPEMLREIMRLRYRCNFYAVVKYSVQISSWAHYKNSEGLSGLALFSDSNFKCIQVNKIRWRHRKDSVKQKLCAQIISSHNTEWMIKIPSSFTELSQKTTLTKLAFML